MSEFLYTFCEPLGLKRRMSGSELCRAMTGGRGMADVYLSLLKVRTSLSACTFMIIYRYRRVGVGLSIDEVLSET